MAAAPLLSTYQANAPGWVESRFGYALGMAGKTEKSTTVLLIAGFKLFKAILLLAAALGTMKLLHNDVEATLTGWAHQLHVDPQGTKANVLINKVAGLSLLQLQGMAGGELFYSGLLFTESIGLFLRRRWAEYFTVITTATFIPVEIYELLEKVSAVKLAVLAINIAIVLYLMRRLKTAA